jgi:hypothetical protein
MESVPFEVDSGEFLVGAFEVCAIKVRVDLGLHLGMVFSFDGG